MTPIIKLLTSECKPNIIGFFAEDFIEKIENSEETEAVYKAFCRNSEAGANAELLNCSYSAERLTAFWAGFETALMLIKGE